MSPDFNQSSHYSSSPPSPVMGGHVVAMARSTRSMNFATALFLSMVLHALVVGFVAGVIALAAFLGWQLFHFDALSMKPRDIQFVLVNTSEQQPINKNTKNRAKQASRAGGKKTSDPKNEPMKKAGTPAPPPKPTPVSKPKPKPQPKVVAKKPTPKPRPKPKITPKPKPKPKVITKAPPRPNLPKPVKTPSKQPTLPPNPIAPTIKTPPPPTPKIASAGPVMNTSPTQSKSGRTGGPVSPSQIPGSTSQGRRSSAGRSGRPSQVSTGNPAWTRGQGGHGSYNQSGSPGGGPGRPGIDALPEPDFGPYMDELQRRIKRNWRPPTAHEDKRVLVYFKIGRDGRLVQIKVQRSSGFAEADQAALAAVKLSAPFRQLPQNYRESSLAIQFTFDYNVKGNFSSARRR